MSQLYTESDREMLQMTISLLKYYVSSEFSEQMSSDWKEVMSDNEMAIQEKIARYALEHRQRFDQSLQGDITLMIADLAEQGGMPFHEFNTTYMKDYLSIKEYHQLHNFICTKAAKVQELSLHLSQYQSELFNLHEHLRAIANVLISMSSMTNGFERKTLNDVYKTLLTTKSVQYFENGYVFDLLVHDRHDAYHDEKLSALLLNPSYLSTHLVTPEKAETYKHLMLCEV